MLFTYKHIPHHIEKLQEYLDFLFHNVWIVAKGNFNYRKLKGNKELYDICIQLEIDDTEWGNFFNGRIAWIFDEFVKIKDDKFKKDLIKAYKANNNIKKLCEDKSSLPITYDDIERQYPDLAKALKSFYGRIYGSSSPFNLKVFGFLNDKLIAEYDVKFMEANNKEVCPFCGINHLKGNNHSYREAYDHYIPKGLYPFNSLNFKNLAPMCHECNSTYKLSKVPIYNNDVKKIDPLIKETHRSLAFFPYAKSHPNIEIKIDLKSKDIINLRPSEIDLKIEATGYDEHVDTWLRVFGMEERYKALLCSPSEGKAWFDSIIDEFENATELSEINDAESYYKAQLKDAKKVPLSSYGFIKSVFLEECKTKGLFKNETPK
ncbi:hypothetical protein [Aquimarina sp. AU474]|uniref:hypothetical protein n=1 Tax=Aquimarina sp. AU474 TaxID=2108529 RepID=UPI000D690CE9|nr:hypothetical protein [Aquimarina sp. AU474]